MNTGSRLWKRFQSKGTSQKLFLTDDLADDQYKKNWPSLKGNSLSCVRYARQYCFPKNRIVPSHVHRFFPGTCSTLLLQRCTTLPTTVVCPLIFNKRLEVWYLDRPDCCLVIPLVCLLLPLHFYFANSCRSASVRPCSYIAQEVMSPDFRSGGKRQDWSWLIKMTRPTTRILASITRINWSRVTHASKHTGF